MISNGKELYRFIDEIIIQQGYARINQYGKNTITTLAK
jgi:hypothetical protein